MPVSYSFGLSNNRLFGLSRLIFYWNGGIFKVIFKDFFVYCFAFALLKLIYILTSKYNKKMGDHLLEWSALLHDNIEAIPLEFILGFFVSQVYCRWWEMFQSIPWPYSLVDTLALALSNKNPPSGREDSAVDTLKVPPAPKTGDAENSASSFRKTSTMDQAKDGAVQAQELEVKILSQCILRLSHLTLAMVLRNICSQFRNLMVKKNVSFVEMGLASADEMRELYSYSELLPHEKVLLGWKDEGDSRKEVASWNFWLPMAWASRLARHAYNKGFIHGDNNFSMLLKKMQEYKGLCGSLTCYDWICIPLPYTQVVSIGIHAYFLLKLFADQAPEGALAVNAMSDWQKYLIPLSLLLKFFVLYGWLKVAECLLNPMGDDSDYNFDMVGIFAMHLEQSRLHLECSQRLARHLEDSGDTLKRMVCHPREDLFVGSIKPAMLGSLFDSVVVIPNVVLDTTASLWRLPAGVFRNLDGKQHKSSKRPDPNTPARGRSSNL